MTSLVWCRISWTDISLLIPTKCAISESRRGAAYFMFPKLFLSYFCSIRRFSNWCLHQKHLLTISSTPGGCAIGISFALEYLQLGANHALVTTQISSWGQHGAHLGPVGPRWAPCWPHESFFVVTPVNGWIDTYLYTMKYMNVFVDHLIMLAIDVVMQRL